MNEINNEWLEVSDDTKVEVEDIIRFDHENKTYCIYRLEDGYYATDGVCTHENVHLEEGLVMDDEIECQCTRVYLILRLVRQLVPLHVKI